MMPTPEQEARLKLCKSSSEYDAEWQRITNENLKTMTERTAAEIRALREQEYDLWATGIGFENQRRGMDYSNPPISSSSGFIAEYDSVMGEKALNEYLSDRHRFAESLPKLNREEILNPSPITITVESKLVVLIAAIISAICILTLVWYTR